MARFENITFEHNSLPHFNKGEVFYSCVFRGVLPDFVDCEFHDCDLSRVKVKKLIGCSLFSCKLDKADFSDADVRFSKTNAGSPCSARGCEWQGVVCVLDCGWFQGLKGSEEDAEIFLIMAMLPETPLKTKLYKSFHDGLKQEARKRLKNEWRKN